MEKLVQLLNYCARHPEAIIRYTASAMLLAVESDTSYLSVTKARSRAAGYLYLTSTPPKPSDDYAPNGAIHVLCHIMREVLPSAAEAELGALFHKGKEACPLCIALEEMGHSQPPTPMATDNSTASGIVTDTVKQKCSKAANMRLYWIWRESTINVLGTAGFGRFLNETGVNSRYASVSESVFYAHRGAVNGGQAQSIAQCMLDNKTLEPVLLWTNLEDYYNTALNQANVVLFDIRKLLNLSLTSSALAMTFISDYRNCLQRLCKNNAKLAEDADTLRALLLVAT